MCLIFILLFTIVMLSALRALNSEDRSAFPV
jgi:hypothetical protein